MNEDGKKREAVPYILIPERREGVYFIDCLDGRLLCFYRALRHCC